uniref:Large ribosomal subunit protein eL21 n=1 Tax=uncultured korarchaeote TaxID=161241 RepID=A0A1L2JM13_9CREN|nr:ribosomal protein L21E [uncultured korarchaeote]
MVKPSKGYRRRTRSLLRKHPRERGMPPPSTILRKPNIGDEVVIKINPAVHRGMPHYRYHGKVAVVAGYRGRAIILKTRLGSKEKTLFVRSEHISLMK